MIRFTPEQEEFRRAVAPLREPMQRLAKGEVVGIPAEAEPFFRDVLDHVVRVSEQVSALDDLLSAALSAHLARVSVQQNDDMRRISAWVAILAVPTMIAGIYGMNFENMPELKWKFGYGMVWLLMAAATGGLLLWFRKKEWI